MKRLILASQSPRRAELLTQMGLPFDVLVTDLDERRKPGERPERYVDRLARGKCEAGVAMSVDAPLAVIGADTIVVLDNEILGKPRSLSDSKTMLSKLSGRTHQVLTGVAVSDGSHLESVVVSSSVTFKDLTDRELAAYLATGEGRDKAGSYGIQGIGGVLVEHIEGSFSAVMGLPVFETEKLLERIQLDTWALRRSQP